MSSRIRNIKLTIAYDGTDYCGWQIQNNEKTVQGTIEKNLSSIHKKDIKITGSGRTDSGVHARAQVANFNTDLKSMPAENFAPALNSLLPKDIRIINSREVPKDFHSRYSAKERIYRYYIASGVLPFPWNNKYCHYVRESLDIKKLNKIVSPLTGVHDFTTFSAPMENNISMTREIYSACFYYEYPYIVFKISGSAFLRKMVRSITGTVLDLYTKNDDGTEMKAVLKAKDRSLAGPTAPARGLFLYKVCY